MIVTAVPGSSRFTFQSFGRTAAVVKCHQNEAQVLPCDVWCVTRNDRMRMSIVICFAGSACLAATFPSSFERWLWQQSLAATSLCFVRDTIFLFISWALCFAAWKIPYNGKLCIEYMETITQYDSESAAECVMIVREYRNHLPKTSFSASATRSFYFA